MLKPGDQLPTVRDLAVELAVNFNTVSKAYSELQRSGVITSAPGRGSFIADLAPPEKSPAERRLALVPEVERMLLAARHLQIGPDEILATVHEGIQKMFGERRPSSEAAGPADPDEE